MSYDIHITRAESYLEDNEPITLAEIEKLLGTLPQGFTIDRTGIVSATTSDGETVVSEVAPYLIYEDEENPDSRVHIYFFDEECPFFSVRDKKYMLPIIELAEKINAKVQGDEEEIYTKESILGNKQMTKKKSGFWSRLFHKSVCSQGK